MIDASNGAPPRQGAALPGSAPIRGVLFDLDGTLIDTAPDMGDALNELLVEHGKPVLPAISIRPHVSNGASALIRLGFGEPGAEFFAKLLERFLAIYSTRLTRNSLPERKPHPRPLLVAAEQMSVTAAECVYLGDAERDMQAARAAGMQAVVARYGYLGTQDPCERWPADAWVDSAAEFVSWWSARRATV